MNSIYALRSKQFSATLKKPTFRLFLFTWIFLSVAFIGAGNIIFVPRQVNRGDLNGDGKIDALDAAILLGNRTDKTVMQTEPPKAQTSGPVKVVSKPIIYVQ